VELGARLLAIAQEAKSEDLMLESHVLAGVTLSYCGPMQEALQHLDAAAAMYVKERHATHAFTFGQDPLMAALSYKGLALWWLGHPDQGQAAADDAVEIARKLGHARSLAFSLANGARCHLKAGDYKRCIVVAEECVELSTRLGFPDFRAMADVHICASRYRLEPSQETLAAIPPALAKLRSVGNSVSTPFYYSLIAEASAEQGHFEQAYDAVTSAHESLKRHGRDCDESEVYRATGVVHGLARKAGDERAEDELPWLRRALTVASEQGAVAWQLQAALTLAERQAGSVHAAEALALLREARTPFVEGKHLPTLRRADALLERTA
jgi:tetratricopeptide (TPR) repeat protein